MYALQSDLWCCNLSVFSISQFVCGPHVCSFECLNVSGWSQMSAVLISVRDVYQVRLVILIFGVHRLPFGPSEYDIHGIRQYFLRSVQIFLCSLLIKSSWSKDDRWLGTTSWAYLILYCRSFVQKTFRHCRFFSPSNRCSSALLRISRLRSKTST